MHTMSVYYSTSASLQAEKKELNGTLHIQQCVCLTFSSAVEALDVLSVSVHLHPGENFQEMVKYFVQ